MQSKTNPVSAIILAAGKGTRMKSDLLKVAHEVAGKPILHYVIESVMGVPVDRVFVVVGHQSEHIKSITVYPRLSFVLQESQLGTGHAVSQASLYFRPKKGETVFVLAGDCPLLRTETLANLLSAHRESNAAATILTARMKDPGSYGRIIHGKMGSVVGIREAKDCSPDELQINEINTGAYCFESEMLFKALQSVQPNNSQKEYYLTDVIGILHEWGHPVGSYCTDTPDEAIGINTRQDLAAINQIIYSRNNDTFMKNGVTIVDPRSTFIDSTAAIGTDTIIYPFSSVLGKSKVGRHCQVGPNACIQNGVVPDHSRVLPFKHLHS